MNTAVMTSVKTKSDKIFLQDIGKIFEMSSALTELTESVLESHGFYKYEFVNGLKRSQNEAKTGKSRSVKSLLNL